MSAKHGRIWPGPPHPVEHAQKIAEYASEAWYGYHGTGNIEVPLSVVAALSLITPPFRERHQIAGELIAADVDVFSNVIRMVWQQFIRIRPDLINRAWPLIEPWEGENYPMSVERRRAAKRVGTAVLRNDLFALTGSERRWEIDLLGHVLTELRPKSARQGRGQYYTPAAITELMARMTMHDLDAKDVSINEPAAGTGGMLRAAAWAMRQKHQDPADAHWEANDVDVMAIACLAVNIVVWELGWNVLLGVGDTLKADWRQRAIAERRETVELVRDLRLLEFMRDLGTDNFRLTTALDRDAEDTQPPSTTSRPDADQPLAPSTPKVRITAHASAPAINIDTAAAGPHTGDLWDLTVVDAPPTPSA